MGEKVDETIVWVAKLKAPYRERPMRKSTANSRVGKKLFKVIRELTPKEVEVMHELKDPDGNPFVPEYTENIVLTGDSKETKDPPIKKKEDSLKLTEAKAKADELGIKYRGNIKLTSLTKKIEEHGTK